MRRFRISVEEDGGRRQIAIVTAETGIQAFDELRRREGRNACGVSLWAEDVGPAGLRGWLKALLLRLARAL